MGFCVRVFEMRERANDMFKTNMNVTDVNRTLVINTWHHQVIRWMYFYPFNDALLMAVKAARAKAVKVYHKGPVCLTVVQVNISNMYENVQIYLHFK